MSQENVEIVRRSIEAWNRRDIADLVEMSDDDLEFVSALNPIDAINSRGPATWATYFARMSETWEEWRVEDFQVFDAGDDRVVAVFRIVGKGKTSGVPVSHQIGVTYRLRQGKLWRLRSYLSQSEALEAVGLSE